MKVTLDLDKHSCIVQREKGDKRIPRSGYSGQYETVLFTHIKRVLKKQGYDLITKRMWKDGHMVNDEQVYIRTRKWTTAKTKEEFCIFNADYHSYDAGQVYNEKGQIALAVEWDW